MNRLEPLSLLHEIGIGQDNKVHITDTVKILVVNLSESLGRAIRTAIIGNKLIIAISGHLKA